MHKYPLFFMFFCLAIGRPPAYDTLNVSDSRFRFAFIVTDTTQKYSSPMKEIIVTSKNSGDTVQRLELPRNEGYLPAKKPAAYLPDVNFDGYSDLEVFVECGGPNCVHLYYLYDKKRKSFTRDTLLENITSATFDAKTKTIASFWRSNCCWHGEDTYRYEKKKPVLIMRKECRGDNGIGDRPYLSTIRVRKKGKMVLVKKRHLSTKYVTTIGFGW